ncbi:MAG: wax ester/triacylglycerol synthase family O-acyltransferase [Gammaproteobacteria bacterium]|nr:wax ester/triacylglycerol synthase family O-acyltransferase [Gammaproteobacteria bacterium]
MRQLGTLDSAFINLEHANTPQHIGGFGIYDPSTAPGGSVRFKDVIENYQSRLQKMPIFSTRLVEVPFGVDKPYWVVDENFDVEFHLRHIALPKPGDWRQLCILIARLHARPLDMKRPLWECYIIEGLDQIEGLPKGAFAVYTKMHHAMVDGSGSESFMAALHDLEPNPKKRSKEVVVADADKPLLAKPPGSLKMLRKATFNNLKSIYTLPAGTLKTTASMAKTLFSMATKKLPAAPGATPKTRFNRPVGPHRVFEACLFELADFKNISKTTETTINDVAVCVVAGAIRKYLELHDELPEETLACMMPMDVSARGNSKENNQIGATVCLIHTDIESHLERLYAINNSTREAKQFVDTPLAEMARIPGILNPWLAKPIAHLYADRQLTQRMPMGSCGAITNVKGPRMPLYSAGAKLVNYYCAGLLTPGTGMFQAVFSMNENITISVLADRDIMPDPEVYKQCMKESLAELKAEAAALKKPATVTALRQPASVKKSSPASTATKPKRATKPKKQSGPQENS